MQAGLEDEEGLEPDNSDDGALDGLPERDSHVAGFLEARRGLGTEIFGFVTFADSPIARDDFEYDLELSLVWRS